jgi:hypothetical protein
MAIQVNQQIDLLRPDQVGDGRGALVLHVVELVEGGRDAGAFGACIVRPGGKAQHLKARTVMALDQPHHLERDGMVGEVR